MKKIKIGRVLNIIYFCTIVPLAIAVVLNCIGMLNRYNYGESMLGNVFVVEDNAYAPVNTEYKNGDEILYYFNSAEKADGLRAANIFDVMPQNIKELSNKNAIQKGVIKVSGETITVNGENVSKANIIGAKTEKGGIIIGAINFFGTTAANIICIVLLVVLGGTSFFKPEPMTQEEIDEKARLKAEKQKENEENAKLKAERQKEIAKNARSKEETQEEKNDKARLKAEKQEEANKLKAKKQEEANRLKAEKQKENEENARLKAKKQEETNKLNAIRQEEENKLKAERQEEANRLKAEKQKENEENAKLKAEKQEEANKLNAIRQEEENKLKAERQEEANKLKAERQEEANKLKAEKQEDNIAKEKERQERILENERKALEQKEKERQEREEKEKEEALLLEQKNREKERQKQEDKIKTAMILAANSSASYDESDFSDEADDSEDEDFMPERDELKIQSMDKISGRVILVRFNRSFLAKLIQSSDEVKNYYSEIKNHILSYEKISNRLSWTYDSYNNKGKQLAKISIRGKTLCLYLALKSEDYDYNKYFQADASDVKKYMKVPMKIKIKSDRGLNHARELVDEVMSVNAINYASQQKEDYVSKYPHQTTEELIDVKLIKELISEESMQTARLAMEYMSNNEDDDKIISVEAASHFMTDAIAREFIEKSDEYKTLEGKLGELNVDTINKAFNDGDTVSVETLHEKGLLPEKIARVKILARGELDKKLTVIADDFSYNAVKMIVLAGGKAIVRTI